MPRLQTAFIALLLLGAGCAERQGVVTGTVTYQDKPVVYGSVVILPADGIPRTTSISPSGAYTFTKVPCGDAKLAVHSPDPALQDEFLQAEKNKVQMGLATTWNRKGPDIDRSKWFAIPAEFSDFEKAGLACTVKQGENSFEIRLK
jgi:hypothetical protein